MNEKLKDEVCRVSGEGLKLVADFGKQPLGNGFLSQEDFEKEYFFDMKAGFCEKSKMFQLIEQPDPEKMFHENYAFYSSLSEHMKMPFTVLGGSCQTIL